LAGVAILEIIAPSTAASRSASSNKKGAFPPNSSEIFDGLRTLGHEHTTNLREPVKVSLRTVGFPWLPAMSLAEPENTDTLARQRSASSASAKAEYGVWVAGFTTTVQLAASAADLARDHGGGKVPWRHRGADANRLFDHD
jgi:hypothetical protein